MEIELYNQLQETVHEHRIHTRKNDDGNLENKINNGHEIPAFTMRHILCIIFILTSVLMDIACAKPANNVEGEAMSYLWKFGYISSAEAEKEAQNLQSVDMEKAIKRLQKMGGIPQTGVIDRRTRDLMHKPRCGVKDPIDLVDRRRKRFVLAPSKWHKKDLTYRIENYTPDLQRHHVRTAISNAFRIWSDVTELTFTEVLNIKADIMIKFASRYHKDGYPFDGKGLILAHAFFPGDDKGGDTHFDEDEHWTFNSTEDGVDIFMVAAHEFGHALGLSHSNEPGALMYPWYQGYDPNFKLPYDDILGIQTIYGGGRLPPVPPSTQRPRPDDRYTLAPPRKGPIDPCKHKFDAIGVIRKEIFLFIGKYFWRSGDPKTLISSEPTIIHDFWYNFPKSVDHIDAVFENPRDRKIIFLSGDRYWVYNGNHPVGGQPETGRPITDFGIPSDIKKIDAVFVWGFNNRIYLISGDMYWKFREKSDTVEPDYPRDMSIWKHVPVPVDAAFQYNSNTYFFKNNQMYKFYDMKMRVAKSFPKVIKSDFLGCKRSISTNIQPLQQATDLDDKLRNSGVNYRLNNGLILIASLMSLWYCKSILL